MLVEHDIPATTDFDSFLQILDLIEVNFKSDHNNTIFSSIIILNDIFNLKGLQLQVIKEKLSPSLTKKTKSYIFSRIS